jgi:hypothetical protein
MQPELRITLDLHYNIAVTVEAIFQACPQTLQFKQSYGI